MRLDLMILEAFSDEDLLAELLRRNGLHGGPARSVHVDPVRETTVPIGSDHSASIRLHAEDVAALGLVEINGDA